MKVLFLNTPLIFSLIPRKYPDISDILSLQLRNESTNITINNAVYFSTDERKLYIELTTQPAEFKTQNKYEITLLNGLEIIYKGKLIVLESGTDIQNYDYGSQTTSRFQYK
jgi:hypothetical protein